jgi:hypothetical protein
MWLLLAEAIAPAMAEDFGDAVRHRAVAVGHAHIDTAWLWPIRETRRKCTRTFASAVALMDDYPEYVFAASSAQHYTWIEEDHPELFARIAELVDRGQWVPVGGMWVEADMNLPSGESLVRQIVFGQRWFEEKFGRRCTEVWIPDVFGYPAGLPQVFAAGGMHRFVTQKLSWNKQNTFPHSTFWWEGLDGSRVLTHFPPVDTYNAEITPEEFGFSIANFKDHAWSVDSLMPFGHGDGGGGPTREMLERARRLAHIESRATLEIGPPDAMFDGSNVMPTADASHRCGAASSTSRPIAARSPARSRPSSATDGVSVCWSKPSCGRRPSDARRGRAPLEAGAHPAVPRHPARLVDRLGARRCRSGVRRGGRRARARRSRRCSPTPWAVATGSPTLRTPQIDESWSSSTRIGSRHRGRDRASTSRRCPTGGSPHASPCPPWASRRSSRSRSTTVWCCRTRR